MPAEIEPIPFYAKGSEKQPFSNFLGNVTIGTVVVVGGLGTIGVFQHTPQTAEAVKDGVATLAVILGTFRSMDGLRQMYNSSSVEVRRQTLQRAAEIRRNPLKIFRRTSQPISAS